MASTVLCVDGDRNYCRILARAFRAEGYAVEVAHDGESALERVRECDPDLVTLDILLPRRDGFSVLEAIRSEGRGRARPVLLLSGCTPTPAYEERARRLAADALLVKPVALDRLLETAGKILGGAPAEPGAAKEGPPLEGSLAEVSFPALLHHLHGMRASGVLELGKGRKRKHVQLRDGRPVAVKSNLVNETLGHLLVASGKLDWEVVHESARRVKRGEGLQGQILVAMQMLDEADLARALRRQAEEKLFELFAWTRGQFRFRRGLRLRSANALALKRSPASVILEGVRTRTPLEAVDAFLGARRGLHPAPAETPFYRFQEADLPAEAAALLRRLDGRRPVAALGALDEDERRALYGLVATAQVELREAPGAADSTPAGTAAAAAAPRGEAEEEKGSEVDEGIRAELAEMAERLRGRDHFAVLGVAEAVDDAEVRAAYTDLAWRTHPDRFSGSGEPVQRLAEEVFGRIAEAYEAIGERQRRLEYLRERQSRSRDAAEVEEGHRALRAELAFQKGQGCLRRRSFAEALEQFEEAVQTYPEEGEYHAYYGWAYYLADPEAPGRLKRALAQVRYGRKLAPDRQKPYLFLGRLYKAGGRAEAAERMFSRAVQIDPDAVDALRELRLIHMRRERSRGIVRRLLRR